MKSSINTINYLKSLSAPKKKKITQWWRQKGPNSVNRSLIASLACDSQLADEGKEKDS